MTPTRRKPLFGLPLMTALLAVGLLTIHLAPVAAHPDATDGPAPSVLTPLTPSNTTLMLIDFQPGVMGTVEKSQQDQLLNNAVALAKSAVAFDVPTLHTGMANGPEAEAEGLIPEIKAVRPNHEVFVRAGLNAWDDPAAISTIERLGQSKLILAGASIETGVTLPALQAMAHGYQVYVVTDASGAASEYAHAMAVARLIQAGVVPVTWQQVTHEWLAASCDDTVKQAAAAVLTEHAD